VGGPVLEASYGLTRRGGRLVTLSAPPSAQRAEQLGIHAMTFVVTPDAAQPARLAKLTDSGKLRTVVSQTFPLRQGPARRSRAVAGRTRPARLYCSSADSRVTQSARNKALTCGFIGRS